MFNETRTMILECTQEVGYLEGIVEREVGGFARSSLGAGNANEIVLGMSLPLTGVLGSTA